MGSKFDVIVVGGYTVDLVFTGLGDLPQLGKNIYSKDFNMTPGEAYISAVSLHRLGLKVGWAVDFGNDDLSQFTHQSARREGLDESLFVHHDRPMRRVSIASSFPTDRAFITYYDPDPPVPAAISALVKSSARILLVPALYSGEFLPLGRRLAQAKKMKIVMDGNSSSEDLSRASLENAAIRKAIRSVDIFLPNALEALRLTGEHDLKEAMQQLARLCPLVVVKDGPNGASAISNGQLVYVPAIPVEPLDTTGAGDNFNAGFLCAWLDRQPLDACLKWGNIVGGLSTSALGGTQRKITRDEVLKYLNDCYS